MFKKNSQKKPIDNKTTNNEEILEKTLTENNNVPSDSSPAEQNNTSMTNNQNNIKDMTSNLNVEQQRIIETEGQITNPQESVKILESTTSNVYNNNEAIMISETSDVKASKHNTILAKYDTNGNLNILTSTLPEKIDYQKKEEVKITKKGKKIKIITKRERIINAILTILFIIAIGAIGYGTYHYLYKNNPANFNTKLITLELGEEPSKRSSDYINLTNVSDMDYILDLSKVENKIGTYQYSIRYNSITKYGTIVIKDTKAPQIIFNDKLDFNLNSNIKKEDIVKECNDPSGCTYELKSKVNTTIPGKQDVVIIAYDENNNVGETSTIININDISIQLTCQMATIVNNYVSNENIILGFDKDNQLVSGNAENKYSYFNEDDYLKAKDSYKNDNMFEFNDEKKEITQLKKITTVNNYKDYQNILNYYQSLGYYCN